MDEMAIQHGEEQELVLVVFLFFDFFFVCLFFWDFYHGQLPKSPSEEGVWGLPFGPTTLFILANLV